MAKIEVGGRKYTVVESLGHQAGYPAKAVDADGAERIAVKRGGEWTWWKPHDRLGLPNHLITALDRRDA